MNIKQCTETIGKITKNTCKILAYGFILALPYLTSKDMLDSMRYSGDVKYSDAVRAIMESNMFDSNKDKVMELLKKDQDSEYYKAVIQVVCSDMFDSRKVNVIKNLTSDN